MLAKVLVMYENKPILSLSVNESHMCEFMDTIHLRPELQNCCLKDVEISVKRSQIIKT